MIFLRIVSDTAQIARWLKKGHILSYFDTPNLKFGAYVFEKGEYITTPNKQLNEILFLIDGSVQIYGIRSDGSISPVNQLKPPAVIGDLEFSNHGIPPFFTEAKTTVICISLSTKIYRKELDCDLRFLHMLIRSYSEKFSIFATLETAAATLEQRVLLYITNVCPSHELHGIEAALLRLRCSRRQLQRVLKKLCLEVTLEKIGKGRYRLVKTPAD